MAKNEKKEKDWVIKRYIIEHYAVIAKTKPEAIEIFLQEGNPHRIEVIKETVKLRNNGN